MNLREFYDITPLSEARLTQKFYFVKQLLQFSSQVHSRLAQVRGSQAATVTALHDLSTTLSHFEKSPNTFNSQEIELTKHTLQSLKQNVDDQFRKAQSVELTLSKTLEQYQSNDRLEIQKFQKMMANYKAKKIKSHEALEKHQKQSFEDLQDMATTLALVQELAEARQEEYYAGISLYNQLRVYEQKYRPQTVLPVVSVLQAVELTTANVQGSVRSSTGEETAPDSQESKLLLSGIQQGALKALAEATDFELAHKEQSHEALEDSSAYHNSTDVDNKAGWLWFLEDRQMDSTPNWFGSVLPKSWKRYHCYVDQNCLYKSEFNTVKNQHIKQNGVSLFEIARLNKVQGGKRAFCVELFKHDGTFVTVQAESEDDLDNWVKIITESQNSGINVEERVENGTENDIFKNLETRTEDLANRAEDTIKREFDIAKNSMRGLFSRLTTAAKESSPGRTNSTSDIPSAFDALACTAEFKDLSFVGEAAPFEITTSELSQAPKSLEVIVDRECQVLKSLESSVSSSNGIATKFTENALQLSSGQTYEWRRILYACQVDATSCGFIHQLECGTEYTVVLMEYANRKDFFEKLQKERIERQK